MFANDDKSAEGFGEDFGLDDVQQPTDASGLSLEDLSQAYAQLLDQQGDLYQSEKSESDEPHEEEIPEGVVDGQDHDDACEVTPQSILEAALFVGTPDNTPLTSKQVASLMRGVRAQEIDDFVEQLNASYEEDGAPYRIVSEGSGYRMVVRDTFHALRDKFYGRVKEARLSQAAVDVLAIVAYNQPLTRSEVDQLRGKPSGAIVSQLVRRQLLAVQRPDSAPRTAQLVTTQRFLDVFGLDSLNNLPRSQELDHPA